MMQLNRNTVVYFTCTALGPLTNGGAICCQNHVRRLAADPDIDLHVVTFGPKEIEHGNREFVQSLGAPFYFIAFQDLSEFDLSGKQYDAELNHLFYWERNSRIHTHIAARLAEIIDSVAPRAIVFDYLPTALFAMPILEGKIPSLVITLANEYKYFQDLCIHHRALTDWARTETAQLRFKRFEQYVYSLAKAVVSFRTNDISNYEDKNHKYHVVSPLFPNAGARWFYNESRTVFFVGNRGHFPNRIALDWLCIKLAPELRRIDPSILIRVIGANIDDEPMYAEANNIEFMGIADRAAVLHGFTQCALFVAPMTIDYGCEIKLQECVSHAMPFIATQAALDGLPNLPFVPVLDLSDPLGTANQIKELLDNPKQLIEMSVKIEERIDAERELQRTIWGKIIADMINTHAKLSAHRMRAFS